MKRTRKWPDLARILHRVSGLVLAAIFIIMGLSGTLLVFKEDYLRLTVPAARHSIDLSPSALAQTAHQAEATFGAGNVRVIVFATADLPLHKVYLASGEKAYLGADGSIIDRWQKNGRPEEWIFDLHHHLLAGDTGQWFAGMAALSGTVFVIAGMVAFWPARRGFVRGLKLKSFKRQDALFFHRNLGILAAPAIIFCLITGTILAFPQTSSAVFNTFRPAPKAAPVSVTGPYKPVNWEAILVQAQKHFPGAQGRVASWPRTDRPAYLRLKQTAEWHPNGRTKLTVSANGNQLAHIENALTMPFVQKVYNGVYPTHAAFIGGRLFDLAIALGGLSMAMLASIGCFTYIKKLARRGKQKTRPDARQSNKLPG